MEKIMLSLVLPVYNVEKYIEKCLQSIIKQDLSQCEVVLVDDGSTDNSGNICDQYAEAYKNFKVLHRSNKGLYQTRLDGARVVRGEYIWFIDSDDWIMEDAIEKLFNILHETQYPDVVIFGFSVNGDAPDKKPDKKNSDLYTFVEKDKAIAAFCTGDEINAIWRKCIRRELIIDNENLPEMEHFSFGEDAYITAAIFQKMSRIVFCDTCLYSYRLNRFSMTRRYNPCRIFDEEISFKRSIGLCIECGLPEDVLRCIEFRGLRELMYIIRSIIESDLTWNEKVDQIKCNINLPFWNDILRKTPNSGLNRRETEIWKSVRSDHKIEVKRLYIIRLKYNIKRLIKKFLGGMNTRSIYTDIARREIR